MKIRSKGKGDNFFALLCAPSQGDRHRLAIGQIGHVGRFMIQRLQEVDIRHIELLKPPSEGFVVHRVECVGEVEVHDIQPLPLFRG